jgi:serine phosphatase RsbU (regulator of sigma subunit)
MKRFLIWIICFLLSASLFSQNHYFDSIWNAYNKVKTDTQKISILLDKIAYPYENISPDSAIKYYKLAEQIAIKGYKSTKNNDLLYEYAFKLGLAYMYDGIILIRVGKNEHAYIHYKAAMKIGKLLQKNFPYSPKTYKLIGETYSNIANYYSSFGKYDKAIYQSELSGFYFKTVYKLDSTSTIGINGLLMVFNNLGNVYMYKGDYVQAASCYYKALTIKEKQLLYKKVKDNISKKGLSSLYANLANIYTALGEYDKALEFHEKSLSIKKSNGDSSGIYSSMSSIAGVYIKKGMYNKAIEMFNEADAYFKQVKDVRNLARNYNNQGIAYASLNNYDKAIDSYKKSMQCRTQLNDVKGNCNIQINLAELYQRMADSTNKIAQKQAYASMVLNYAKPAVENAKKFGLVEEQFSLNLILQKAYALKENYKDAYNYSLMVKQNQDSMFGKEKTKALAEMQTKYETEKKQLLIDKLNKENALKQARLEKSEEQRKRQRTIIFSLIIIFILIAASLFIISRMFVKLKKAHVLLHKQKNEIVVKNAQLEKAYEEIKVQKEEIETQRDIVIQQKEHIQEINTKITDSINYAQRIQMAVLPSIQRVIDTNTPNKFEYGLLFKPKDIVSGDFYWVNFVNDHLIIAIADCTGHGVPGAFMSMLGISILNEIVRKKEITKTNQALANLRDEIIYVLQQKGISGEQKDGMDIGLVVINSHTMEMQFSGANNNLIYLPANSGEVIEIKGDKMPVAIYERMEEYTNHHIKLNQGDIFYLSSDGYKDQFGGPKGKKFLHKNFIHCINEIRTKPLHEQTDALNKAMNSWMNTEQHNYQQIDDITVLGIKVL